MSTLSQFFSSSSSSPIKSIQRGTITAVNTNFNNYTSLNIPINSVNIAKTVCTITGGGVNFSNAVNFMAFSITLVNSTTIAISTPTLLSDYDVTGSWEVIEYN